jgi:hypothetical protein
VNQKLNLYATHSYTFACSFPVVFLSRGARWPRGQCARRTITEAKQRFQWSVIRWEIKIYYLELLRASCIFFVHIYYHHQPINVPTAGAQAFILDHT